MKNLKLGLFITCFLFHIIHSMEPLGSPTHRRGSASSSGSDSPKGPPTPTPSGRSFDLSQDILINDARQHHVEKFTLHPQEAIGYFLKRVARRFEAHNPKDFSLVYDWSNPNKLPFVLAKNESCSRLTYGGLLYFVESCQVRKYLKELKNRNFPESEIENRLQSLDNDEYIFVEQHASVPEDEMLVDS